MTKHKFIAEKLEAIFICRKKETCNIFPRADWHEWKWQLCSSLNEIESVLNWSSTRRLRQPLR